MHQLLTMILLFCALQSNLLFDFTTNASINDWTVVNDVVMGGESSSTIKLNEEGHGVFEGNISLDNN